MKISVAMATYNGERFLKEQIDSVLSQLKSNDELIISDDGSTDDTINIISSYLSDSRVHFFRNPNKGIIKNFEHAISKTNNEIIFLCDQDDIWLPNKISLMSKEFKNSGIGMVVSDAKFVDTNLKELNNTQSSDVNWRKGLLRNFTKNTYVGCCMAFNRNLKEIILPFPDNIPMHDVWIGMLAELNGINISYIQKELMLHRRHNDTATGNKRNKLQKIIHWRLSLFKCLLYRQIKVKISKINI